MDRNTIAISSPFDNSSRKSISDSNASSSSKKPLNLWPSMYRSPMMIALWETKSSSLERILDLPLDAPPQTELLTKTPLQSRMAILYNFSSDAIFREQYRDAWNEVRIGKLLEDLDALAGTISVKHCSDEDNTTRPLYLVTASVDKMVLKKPISADNDLKVTGAVIWVGRSSIEVQLDVSQPDPEMASTDQVALTANFIFVARDYKTRKAAPVNRLIPETEREKLLYRAADARNNQRKRKFREENCEAENGEKNRVEGLLAEGRIFCDMPALADRDSILLEDTCLENSMICQPQQRNIHGRIFGGFLMNRAYELAFSTAYTFAGMMPSFLEVDHVDFLRPVDVGDFLRFKSCVLYTECDNLDRPLIRVEVVAHVTSPECRSSEVSNRFNFTFTVRAEAKATMNNACSGRRIRKVVPATEEEAHRIIARMDADSL